MVINGDNELERVTGGFFYINVKGSRATFEESSVVFDDC
jgi:hypothetical protein